MMADLEKIFGVTSDETTDSNSCKRFCLIQNEKGQKMLSRNVKRSLFKTILNIRLQESTVKDVDTLIKS